MLALKGLKSQPNALQEVSLRLLTESAYESSDALAVIGTYAVSIMHLKHFVIVYRSLLLKSAGGIQTGTTHNFLFLTNAFVQCFDSGCCAAE
jgi:hypothetical protein